MRFFATCARGTEGALKKELSGLKLHAVRGERGGVSFEGKLEAGMRVCLHTRTAMRVLLELARFPAADADGLYAGARAIDWEPWLTAKTTLAVDASVQSETIVHSGFAALKVKDAVVDALRDKLGARPDVDTKDPDVRIVLHLSRGEATLSLDLAGDVLHRRGYRVSQGPAPLKETLAAAVLLLGGADLERPFVDPMAGSGTLPIEFALRARRIAPGLDRAFAFQRWPSYRGAPQSAWDRLRAEARAAVLPRAPARILARDMHPKALEALRRNVLAARLEADIEIEAGDARDLEPTGEPGTLAMNPPYGERLMSGDDETGSGHRGKAAPPRAVRRDTETRKLSGFYRGLGEMVGRHHGWTALLLSGNPLLLQALPVKPEIDHRLWNGPLEVRLYRLRVP
ncbi:MAG: THUMP domain-containing protein [Anaeromyxobacteraceae bacterium]